MKRGVLFLTGLLVGAASASAGTVTFSEISPTLYLLTSSSNTSSAFASSGILLTLCGSMNGSICVPLTSGPSFAGTGDFGGPTTGESMAIVSNAGNPPVTLQITFAPGLVTGSSLSFLVWDTESMASARMDNGSGGGLLTQIYHSGIQNGVIETFSNLPAGTSRLLLTDDASDGFLIDNLTFLQSIPVDQGVPEPGTFGLLGAALIGLGAIGYRRRAA